MRQGLNIIGCYWLITILSGLNMHTYSWHITECQSINHNELIINIKWNKTKNEKGRISEGKASWLVITTIHKWYLSCIPSIIWFTYLQIKQAINNNWKILIKISKGQVGNNHFLLLQQLTPTSLQLLQAARIYK